MVQWVIDHCHCEYTTHLERLTITPAAMSPMTSLWMLCVVTDPDETLTPAYEWSIGSSVVGSGTTLDLSASGAMPNDVVTCTAAVVDGDGATDSDSATVTVQTVPPVSLVLQSHRRQASPQAQRWPAQRLSLTTTAQPSPPNGLWEVRPTLVLLWRSTMRWFLQGTPSPVQSPLSMAMEGLHLTLHL